MRPLLILLTLLLAAPALRAQMHIPHNRAEDTDHVMGEAYWAQWNDTLQAGIDAAIERNRKADTVVAIPGIRKGTTVHVEQLGHAFFFGAHIFNYNQLGSADANARYRELFGTLFNSATVAFYWKTFEDRPGRLRFATEYWDTEDYWNGQEDPKHQFHWRRPASDQAVDWCLGRGVRVHGHPLIWGNRRWHHPDWIQDQFLTGRERETWNRMMTGRRLQGGTQDEFSPKYRQISNRELSDSLPQFARQLRKAFRDRIVRIAQHYGDRIKSWDVVNESTADYEAGCFREEAPLCRSTYGIMPGEYVRDAFRTADSLFGPEVKLNINDYKTGRSYADWTDELLRQGCRIDVLGSQMHLFRPQQCLDLAAGKTGGGLPTPVYEREVMERLSRLGRPIHLSEITITAPGDDDRGRMIQAILARNLYRLWFSIERMEGITWWNVVDDCGAPGEPSVSGLFFRNMEPKPAYHALRELIDEEWKTRLDVRADRQGKVSFRGFRGRYRLTWKDGKGQEQSLEMDL